MIRYLLILSCFFLYNCKTTDVYKKVHIVDQRKNQNGKVIYRQIKQLHRTQFGDKYITTFQEFDSLGRKIKEYGHELPGSLNKYIKTVPDTGDKYLYEYFYVDKNEYLRNTYIWPDKSNSNFTPLVNYLVHQTYRPNTVRPLDGAVEIDLIKRQDSFLIGAYQRFQYISDYQYEWAEFYDFKILSSKMKFDSIGLLEIENVADTFNLILGRKK